ncbi:MAG: hypothetical protein QM523_04830 [Candidatus Pacebacteria bacterium]|nr:hypothetical protein [Candidatus Paceibacterota bacterium]
MTLSKTGNAKNNQSALLLSHSTIWRAIDRLASQNELTASGLAKLAGLDATTFNPSRRTTLEGKNRWPSTETISKILQVTGTGPDEFVELLRD